MVVKHNVLWVALPYPIDYEFPILPLTWKRVIFTHHYPKIEYSELKFVWDTGTILNSNGIFENRRAETFVISARISNILSVQVVNPPYRLSIANFSQVDLGGGQARMPQQDL